MGLTVREAIALGYLDGCALLGGHRGLDREIRLVSVLEVPEHPADWVYGGELVVTAFFSVRSNPSDQVRLIESLYAKGAAGIVVFYVGLFCPEIAESLVDRADELGFPLLQALDQKMAYGDIIKPIMADVSLRQLATIAATHLDDPSALDSRESLVRHLSRGLGGPVFMVDSEFKSVEPRDVDENHAALIEECHARYGSRQFSEIVNGIVAMNIDTQASVLLGALPDFLRESRGYVLAVQKGNAPWEHGKAMLMSIAIRMYAAIQNYKRTIGHIETLSKDSYLSDLLSGRVRSAEAIIERGRLVGLDMANKRQVFVVGWTEEWPGFQTMLRSFSAPADSICFRGHGRLVVIRSAAGDDDSRLMSELRRIWDLSGKPDRDAGFAVGIGSRQSKVEHLFRSYTEACEALRLHGTLSSKLGYCETPALVRYRDVAYVAMFEGLAADPVNREHARNTLAPVIEFDEQRTGGHLVQTMFVHLWEGCDIGRTAGKLFVHRNTLNYRFKRIAELLCEDPFEGTNMPKYLVAAGIHVFAQGASLMESAADPAPLGPA